MNDSNRDNDMPNGASNMQKAGGDRVDNADRVGNAEQDRWRSDPDTIERQDRDRLESGATTPADEPSSQPDRRG